MSRIDLLPGAGPVLSLRQAIYRSGRDYRGGLTALAFEMGVDYDVLQKKTHIEDNGRYFKPEELEELVALTKDPRLLAALVRPAGALVFRPQPVPANGEALTAVGNMLADEGAFVASLHKGAADARWERHEVEDLRVHAHRVIASILSIVAGAEEAMEADV